MVNMSKLWIKLISVLMAAVVWFVLGLLGGIPAVFAADPPALDGRLDDVYLQGVLKISNLCFGKVY